MRRLAALGIMLAFAVISSMGGQYRLTNGDILTGEPSSFNDDGLVVRLDVGGFSPRVGWGKFTQETLKDLAQNPQAKPFVEPYIDIPIEEKLKERQQRKAITIKDPPTVQLPAGKPAVLAAIRSPLGLFVLGVLYLANLYAAMEVARFRNRPAGLVVGVSALFPIIGPILFAALPSAGAVHEAPVETAAPEPASATPAKTGPAPGVGLAAHAGGGGAAPNAAYNQVYTRSNTTFDRRFFETKFTGFFRVVPADAEKDLVLVVKGAKAQYIARRISRISANEMHLQLQQGGTEVSIPFGEIVEVSVKHKDAK